jgi:voltage-gated sodium channel
MRIHMPTPSPENRGFVRWCRRISDDRRFGNAILAIILLNAVLVGLETSPALAGRWQGLFQAANTLILAIFLGELAVRIAAHGWRFGDFLRDGWNVFDLVVVALSLVPGVGAFATVARIARVLRVARLVSVSPKLRLIVGTMTRSIPSLAHVSLLLGLLLYMYAVIGVNIFGAHDPEHWGGLGPALLTLFQMLTLEGWVELQDTSLTLTRWAWVYYGSFVIVAVFVVVNLFIAVVLNNLDEIREEDRKAALVAAERQAIAEGNDADRIISHVAAMRAELDRLEALVKQRSG